MAAEKERLVRHVLYITTKGFRGQKLDNDVVCMTVHSKAQKPASFHDENLACRL